MKCEQNFRTVGCFELTLVYVTCSKPQCTLL